MECPACRDPKGIFVFGSNLAGRHGKGAALHARQVHGAVYGDGQGRQGHSYGLATKDHSLRALSLEIIQKHVWFFQSSRSAARTEILCHSYRVWISRLPRQGHSAYV